jgi:hypothetical protein
MDSEFRSKEETFESRNERQDKQSAKCHLDQKREKTDRGYLSSVPLLDQDERRKPRPVNRKHDHEQRKERDKDGEREKKKYDLITRGRE